MNNYLSIAREATGMYREKGSKFIAYAYPVSVEEDVKDKLEELKKKHYNAQHHCYAYLIGQTDEAFKAFDDGEPRHTAGDPILNQIRSVGLKDILIVVVRYFGGTKLGKTGLIRAYKTAAREVLSNAVVVEKVRQKTIHLNFKYEGLNEVMHILQRYDSKILHQNYKEDCSIICLLPEASVPEFLTTLRSVKAMQSMETLPR